MNVFITGGSRGIGASCVRLFAKNKYNVAFTYLNNEGLAIDLKNELEEKYDVKIKCYKCDVSSESDVLRVFERVKNDFGSLDVIVNNAGISSDCSISEKTVLEFRYILDVNLVGIFTVVKYFKELIKSGSIINVASNDGIDTCYKDEMDYAASKAGVISLTKTMAKEFAPNIRVNAVAPGWVETDMSRSDIPDYEIDLEKELILLRRFAKPMEIAKVIYFLASDDSSYINGEIIKVDGGY